MDPIAEWAATWVRVHDLMYDVDDERADEYVPACPDWTVRDLLAHMVGLVVDVARGDEPDDHNAAWTQRQVEERRGLSVLELLGEFTAAADALKHRMRAHGTRPLNDVVIHEQDLRGALGVPGGQDNDGLRIVRDRMLDQFARRLGSRAITLTSVTWQWSSADGGPTVTASEFDLARALVSRRSAAQLRAWTTDGVIDPLLDAFQVLGPLPSTWLVE